MKESTPPAAPADARARLMVHAVRPTLFSVAAYPDLLMALVLANLTSPRLWELARRMNAGTPSVHRPGEDPPRERLHRIQHFVNAHFYHAVPAEFGLAWGLQERETIDDADERRATDYAMHVLREAIRGTHDLDDHPGKLERMLKSGLFPQHAHSTVDVILAHGPHLRHDHRGHPLGMTSCLDECVLIAALAVASGCCTLDGIVFLGAPSHYTLFVFTDECGGWFNGKRSFFDTETWREWCSASPTEGPQGLVDLKLPYCDRLVALRGHCLFPRGQTTLGRDHLARIVRDIGRFEGTLLRQAALALQCSSAGPIDDDDVCGLLCRCMSREDFERVLVETAGRTNWLLPACALHAGRDRRHVPAETLLEAASHGFEVFVRSGEILRPEDALLLARGIRGHDSVFGETHRVAMPDEVLYFGTANPSERALLAHTLLELSPRIPPERRSRLITDTGEAPWQLQFEGSCSLQL